AESKHYRSIVEREDALRHVVVLSERFPPATKTACDTTLVTGSVVVSVDYFKTVVAALRNLVGGNISAYESLIDRARREALLRMQAQADAMGSAMIINVKFETSRVSGNADKSIGSVEVLAYGTALLEPNRLAAA
ncbi:MAG: YbjQ family protein, partial [Pseudomonadales bacterium]